jgi:predicted metal-binding transcription factor (methanogenesis marker protein 9)
MIHFEIVFFSQIKGMCPLCLWNILPMSPSSICSTGNLTLVSFCCVHVMFLQIFEKQEQTNTQISKERDYKYQKRNK